LESKAIPCVLYLLFALIGELVIFGSKAAEMKVTGWNY